MPRRPPSTYVVCLKSNENETLSHWLVTLNTYCDIKVMYRGIKSRSESILAHRLQSECYYCVTWDITRGNRVMSTYESSNRLLANVNVNVRVRFLMDKRNSSDTLVCIL